MVLNPGSSSYSHQRRQRRDGFGADEDVALRRVARAVEMPGPVEALRACPACAAPLAVHDAELPFGAAAVFRDQPLDDLRRELPIPVIGVIEPGAEAAQAAHAATNSTDPSVLVLATSATVQSKAYTRALAALGLSAYEMACPLLVPLVEEGWIDHPVTDEVLRIYLDQALTAAPHADTLLLGCTHYPLLEPALRRTLAALGHPLTIIDSAHATAHATARLVAQHFPAAHLEAATTAATTTCTFYATDSVEKFQRLGSHFLGRALDRVHLIDLGG